MNRRPRAKPLNTASVGSGPPRHLQVVAGSAVRPMKTAESVARDIVHDIVAAGLLEGSALPPEGKMLEQYGVSRESLREALRLLESQGFLSIRRGPGGGPIVGTVDPANLGRVATLYYQLVGATYGELFEAWTVAEGYLAERAARNPDRPFVRATIEPFVDRTADDVESWDGVVDQHVLFHNALGTLAGNRVMQLSLMAVGQTVARHVVVASDPRELTELLCEDHSTIARAVVDGRPAKARDEMRAHLRRIATLYSRLSGGAVPDQLIEWQ